MAKRFSVTVDDEYMPGLEWVLAQQREHNPDEAPSDVAGLVQAAVEGLILKPYLGQMNDHRVRRARAGLGAMPPAERERLLAAIEKHAPAAASVEGAETVRPDRAR